MKKLVVITGPTASGKSDLALEISKRFNGEIVSCDSMQIYKYMDIGTAKPSPKQTSAVPHHMINVADPAVDTMYSCADFQAGANEAVRDIISRGKIPVLCGGTGLYIDSVVNATEFPDIKTDEAYRKALFDAAAEKGSEYVFSILKEKDPDAADAIHPNNLKRVIRALEIYHATGKTKTEWDKLSHISKSEYNAAFIGLAYRNREKLYNRIDSRVDSMVKNGLYDEVSMLYETGKLVPGSTAAQAIGYKEMLSALRGDISFADAVEKVKRESRRYAKRQLTWFKRNPAIYWIYPDDLPENADTFKIIVNIAAKYLTDNGFCDILSYNSTKVKGEI